MDVMDVDDSLNCLETSLEFIDIDVFGSRLHEKVVGIFEDGNGGDESDDGEDVGRDGVEEVPGRPLVDVFHIAVGGSQQENDQRTEDETDAHDHVG